jgi:adenine-specific DNA-methyltransferase
VILEERRVHGRNNRAIIKQQVLTEAKATGATYTPKDLSDFVARQIVTAADHGGPSDTVRVLDPAIGEGDLLISLLERLTSENHRTIEAFGFETNKQALNLASARLKKLFPKVTFCFEPGSFLDYVIAHYGEDVQGNLLRHTVPQPFDLIIANPPYVRTQVMGAANARILAQQFGLSGRIDLYHAFIIAIGQVLRTGGTAGVIVSNRFMTTRSGSSVRRAILDCFDVRQVWDLGDTKLFKAAILPAVLLLEKAAKDERRVNPAPRFTSAYSTDVPAQAHASDALAALETSGVVEVEGGQRFLVQHGVLDNSGKADGVWRIATDHSNSWLSTVQAHTWCVFGDLGKIRVGVKTTADRVFIRSDWNEMGEATRPELLRPLITHHMARRFKAAALEKPKHILYPHHVVDGKRCAVDLNLYPRTRRYLEQHREALESRRYVIEAGRKWYEIWVPQDPNAWDAPKVVFRDISKEPTFWVDEEGSVVNGDCYWLTCRDQAQADLLWLAVAVGNSKFIETFYDHRFHNRLYAGRRRFITQYVEEFPLPNPNGALGVKMIEMAKRIYALAPSREANVLERELDTMVWSAFGLPIEEVAR